MELRSISVEAFKSLYELRARFDHMTVVTGPNGSGKSNLVDALTFVSDTYRHGLEFAVSKAGGYENIAHRRTRRAKRPIVFEVEVEVSHDELKTADFRNLIGSTRAKEAHYPARGVRLRHRFGFRASSQRVIEDFVVIEEALQVDDFDGNVLVRIEFPREAGTLLAPSVRVTDHSEVGKEDLKNLLKPFLDDDFEWERWARIPSPTDLAASNFRYYSLNGKLAEHLSQIQIFQLSPHLSRTAGVATPNAELGRHGENLPGAADNLQRRRREAWVKVETAMRAIIPGLQTITVTPTEDRRLAVQFREKGIGRPWNASEVSDGTIQTLALLVALFDDRTSMLIIEEPENAVHPWILRHIVDLARTTDKQILFTTHSPVLLNYIDPEIIWLMWMRQGRSALRRLIELDPDLTNGLVDGSLPMFDTYDSGLFLEAVPRGLAEPDTQQ